MFRWLLLGLCLAIVDPVLLYVIYRQWGGTALLAVIAGPILLSSVLSAWSQRGLMREMQANPQPAHLADSILIRVGGALTFYPGPLSSIAGLLLLLPPIRRTLREWVAGQFLKSMTGGNFVVTSFGQSPDIAAMPPAGPAGPLKPAEGRIIDDQPRLTGNSTSPNQNEETS